MNMLSHLKNTKNTTNWHHLNTWHILSPTHQIKNGPWGGKRKQGES